jgi:hypothetical protein
MAGTLDGRKIVRIFSGLKSIMPIVEKIVFAQSVYGTCFMAPFRITPGGGETTFAIAVIHHQNSSKS